MAHDSHAENLRAELKSLADTLEEVLNSSTDKPKAELDKLRSKAEGALKETRARLSDAGDKLAHQTKQMAGQADDYVRENPWTGIGIGAAVGVVLGVLLARRLLWQSSRKRAHRAPVKGSWISPNGLSPLWSAWWKPGCVWP